MKIKFIVFFIGFLLSCLLSLHQAHATAYGQVTISTPSSGGSYSSSSNVSTSVSWASTSTSGLYLDRRVFLSSGAAITSASSDTCYFSPVAISASSGTQSGTLRDGSGSASSTYSSASCFTGGSGADYYFVATIVYCSGSSYSSVSSCLGTDGYIIARSTRYFSHD